MEVEFPQEWAKCDRFYGQRMSEKQIKLIRFYHNQTPACEVPLWAYALRYIVTGCKHHIEMSLPWDYGLENDLDLLVRSRRSQSMPFTVMPGLWDKLKARKAELMIWNMSEK